jgi:GxxExxY protein
MKIVQINSPNIIEKELSYKIVGVLFEVHNKLGGEYQEKYYQRAVANALRQKGLKFKEQLPVDLKFNSTKIGKYFLDFLIENKIVLEIKAVPSLKPIHFRQVRAYLKVNNLPLGILANFRGSKVSYNRILYPIRSKNSNNLNSDTLEC